MVVPESFQKYGKVVYELSKKLIYFTAAWYILWLFGIIYVYLVHSSRFGMLHQEKAGNPVSYQRCSRKNQQYVFFNIGPIL
jgi:hypothetical protein